MEIWKIYILISLLWVFTRYIHLFSESTPCFLAWKACLLPNRIRWNVKPVAWMKIEYVQLHYIWNCITQNYKIKGKYLSTTSETFVAFPATWPVYPSNLNIQCGAVITESIFSQMFKKTPHSSPVRVRYGVSFLDPASDWYSASVLVIIYGISYKIGPR